MKVQRILSMIAVLVIAPLLAFSLTSAQSPDQQTPEEPDAELSTNANVRSRISYQGVLEESGSPVNGRRNIVFRFHGNSDCTDASIIVITKDDVQVTNGLFGVELDILPSMFGGLGWWLRVVVEGTELGCEEILPVPYAISLVPGAQVLGTNSGPLVSLRNTKPSGTSSIGIAGVTNSPEGYGGSFENQAGGAALRASGSIESTADSYIFVPAADAVLHGATSGATLKYWGDGSATLVADTVGEKEIIFPITLPAVLYGQPARVDEIALSFHNTEFVDFNHVWVYRRALDGNVARILDDRTGWSSASPQWKTLTFPIDSDNVLSVENGQLAVRITVDFGVPGNKIEFTGVRVRIGHDE